MTKKQPKWNKYEVVLLMDTFIQIESGKAKYQDAIMILSELLRNYAINNDLSIDEQYRNKTGIDMKYQNIRFLYTEGQDGLARHSKLDKEIVCLYKEQPNLYKKLLSEAKQIYTNYL